MAVIAGRSVTLAEVESEARGGLLRVRVEEYAVKRRALERLIDRTVLEEEARRRGLPVDDLVQSEVKVKTRPVTPDEVATVLEASKNRMGATSDPPSPELVAKSMQDGREREARTALVKELRKRASVRILLEPPRAPVQLGDGPTLGPSDARVTIVAFIDYQCPYCARITGPLQQIREKRAQEVRLVIRHFPLSIHADATRAAEAAACAQDQGKFWELHEVLMANQKTLSVSDLNRFATQVGIDVGAFDTCLASGSNRGRIQKDIVAGRSYGVAGTPTIFVNGRPYLGVPALDDLVSAVEEELGTN